MPDSHPPDRSLPREPVAAILEQLAADGSWAEYGGVWTRRLQERLCKTFGATTARLTCSGTLAVELALRGVGVRSGDEVILAAYDFPGNFRSIEAIGARPVLVDVVAAGWTLDPAQLDAAYCEATRAVIVSHLHGQLARIDVIRQWCDRHNVALVEDACQVPGARVGGRPAGAWGDASALSFGGSKLLTAGRGGAVLTSSEEIAQRMTVFAERGNDAFPLSQLQAAVLLPQLDELALRTEQRRRGAEALMKLLEEASSVVGPGHWKQEDIPAFYKFGVMLPESETRGPAEIRQRILEAARDAELPVGTGFRGFHLRSLRRCRRVGDLAHARTAAAATVLIDHRVLQAGDSEQDSGILARIVELFDRWR